MSEFHGGFLIPLPVGDIESALIAAVRAYLIERRIEPRGLQLAFATRKGCPVVHVAVRGGLADGKGYATFHHQHRALGAAIARAASRKVWAYSYENQSGSEGIARFAADGSRESDEYASWDDIADQLEIGDSDQEHARLMAALPLGRLARELGVPRSLLDMDLAYDTSTASVPLDGQRAPGTLASYLAGRLDSMSQPPLSEDQATAGIYFPKPMLDDIAALADRLRVPIGTLVWAAWEHGKPALYAEMRGLGESFEQLPARAAPPAEPPPELLVPEQAPEVPAIASSDSTKVLARIALPERVVGEITEQARFGDRSMSWTVQKAYLLARTRLHAARRTD
jgi:hypothetical protein